MLQFPQSLTPQGFLEGYWQKSPLFLQGSLPQMEPVIDDDELAWLATQDDVESRLIISETRGRKTLYKMEQGPFTEARLQELPDRNWTLLVQDVDKHLPDFREYFAAADFIPDWRIDDLMISVAAPGGSVGPHRDNYDVFLIQATGRREWRTAAPDAVKAARQTSPLVLLEPFQSYDCLTASPSDALYLPPGVPHWGIAEERCTTYSLGMRAPTRSELQAALEFTDAAMNPETEMFYADPDLLIGEALPGMISDQALQRARVLLGEQANVDTPILARAFGCMVTTPKPWLAPELPDSSQVAKLRQKIQADSKVRSHGMARLAWCESTAGTLVFANGTVRSAAGTQLRDFRALCTDRTIPTTICHTESGLELMEWLIAAGAIDLTENDLSGP
ncbi:MAG TPA: cupin domain-containing protein [Woeseiaceae bacterium]